VLDIAAEALTVVLQPGNLLYLLFGVLIGLCVGLIPGLSGIVGMSVVLPFLFGMDPGHGIAMLLGMIAVIHTADTFPSVLLGVPGTAGSQATIMDGYPMARKGEAARALGAAFTVSLVGGLVGAIFLFGVLPIVRPLILALGSPELFMLTLFGLSMVAALSRGSMLMGLVAGLFGLLLGTIGSAPTAVEMRFVFGISYLWDGIPLAAMVIGLFAIPELIDLLARGSSISSSATLGGGMFSGVRDAFRNKWLATRSALLGAGLGMVPGLGASVVDWISYGVAKQTARDPDSFGKGDVRGVIAPEAANNAKEGGSLVPTLMFGIPGSATTAVLLGGLGLMGVRTGPSMVGADLPITLSIIWTLAVANVVGAGICFLLSGRVAKLSLIPAASLAPFLLVILLVGAYQSSRHWGDILVFVVMGVIGWAMKHARCPRPPLLIGFVLATASERYLSIAMQRYDLEWLMRPGVMIIALLIVASIYFGLRRERVA
jgi:putative tricarboxylic transport membrane protein